MTDVRRASGLAVKRFIVMDHGELARKVLAILALFRGPGRRSRRRASARRVRRRRSRTTATVRGMRRVRRGPASDGGRGQFARPRIRLCRMQGTADGSGRRLLLDQGAQTAGIRQIRCQAALRLPVGGAFPLRGAAGCWPSHRSRRGAANAWRGEECAQLQLRHIGVHSAKGQPSSNRQRG